MACVGQGLNWLVPVSLWVLRSRKEETEGCGDSVIGDAGVGLGRCGGNTQAIGPMEGSLGCLGWSEQALGLCVGPGG